MKNTVFTLVIVSIATFLFSQCSPHFESSFPTNSADQDQAEISYSNEDLQGDWTLIKVETVKEKQSIERYNASTEALNPEAYHPVFLNQEGQLVSHDDRLTSIRNKDLHVHEDSIYWLDYPIQIEQRNHYTIDAEQLKIGRNPDALQIELSDHKDTLILSYLGDFGLYFKETYLKVSFDDSVLNILKQHTINLPHFAGTWRVFREGNINNDGTEYVLNFPYKIPDSVQITRSELTDVILKNKPYQMLTNGQKRAYTLDYYDDQIILSPTNWLPENYEGSTSILLDRSSIERQELSPQECWNEFLQVIRSGNVHNTIDLMTSEGFHGFCKKTPHKKFELDLKLYGLAWQGAEIRWNEISKTQATATFDPSDNEWILAFVKEGALWKIDVLTTRD